MSERLVMVWYTPIFTLIKYKFDGTRFSLIKDYKIYETRYIRAKKNSNEYLQNLLLTTNYNNNNNHHNRLGIIIASLIFQTMCPRERISSRRQQCNTEKKNRQTEINLWRVWYFLFALTCSLACTFEIIVVDTISIITINMQIKY